MNSDIPLEMTAIFFNPTFIENRQLARCMSCLISFAWAYSSWRVRETIITKKKFLPTAGLELTTLGLRIHNHNH